MSKQAKPQRLTVFLFASPLMPVIKSAVSGERDEISLREGLAYQPPKPAAPPPFESEALVSAAYPRRVLKGCQIRRYTARAKREVKVRPQFA
jgi:hypothetical protein